jgi:hypothetical protein
MTTTEDGESSSDYYTLGQQVSLTIGTSLAAALSIAGSTAIVYVICVDHGGRKSRTEESLITDHCPTSQPFYVFWALAIRDTQR